jgi:tetratricopeptide (TPR) repeat protein
MKAIRALLALLFVAALAAVIAKAMIPRLQCNLAKGRMNREVRAFGRSGDEYARLTGARENVETCRHYLTIFPEDHQLYMLLAANLRVLGSLDEAVENFRHALTLTERPEIYAQIGELEIERGNIEAGRAAMTKAATFHMLYVETVDEPLRSEIYKAVMARYERLQAAAKK